MWRWLGGQKTGSGVEGWEVLGGGGGGRRRMSVQVPGWSEDMKRCEGWRLRGARGWEGAWECAGAWVVGRQEVRWREGWEVQQWRGWGGPRRGIVRWGGRENGKGTDTRSEISHSVLWATFVNWFCAWHREIQMGTEATLKPTTESKLKLHSASPAMWITSSDHGSPVW